MKNSLKFFIIIFIVTFFPYLTPIVGVCCQDPGDGGYSLEDCENLSNGCYRPKNKWLSPGIYDSKPFEALPPLPTTGGRKWYRGTTHTHSNNGQYHNGQGLLNPKQVPDIYRKLGYDFFQLSDHNVYTKLSDCDKQDLDMQNMYSRRKHFLVFEGEEVGRVPIDTDPSKHVTAFSMAGPTINPGDTLYENINRVWNDIRAIPFINHPYSSELSISTIRNAASFWMEVNSDIGDIPLWENVLKGTYGSVYYGVGSDDSHPTDVNDCADGPEQGKYAGVTGKRWIVVKLPVQGGTTNLTEDNISNAIWYDSFYIGRGGVILDYDPEVRQGPSQTITAYNADKVTWHVFKADANGTKITPEPTWDITPGVPVTYNFAPDDDFCRAVFWNSLLPDSKAYTQPFYKYP